MSGGRFPDDHDAKDVKTDEGDGETFPDCDSGETDPKRGWGSWTVEEDEQIGSFVQQFGTKKWTRVGMFLKRRTGKQCRERWHNHLNPDIRRDRWSREEDETIIREHIARGSRWSEIAKFLPGRTDNAIKNRWNSTMRRVQRHCQVSNGNTPGRRSLTQSGDGSALYRYCLALNRLGFEEVSATSQIKEMCAKYGERDDGFSIPVVTRTRYAVDGPMPLASGGTSISHMASASDDDLPAPMIDDRLLDAANILFLSASPGNS